MNQQYFQRNSGRYFVPIETQKSMNEEDWALSNVSHTAKALSELARVRDISRSCGTKWPATYLYFLDAVFHLAMILQVARNIVEFVT